MENDYILVVFNETFFAYIKDKNIYIAFKEKMGLQFATKILTLFLGNHNNGQNLPHPLIVYSFQKTFFSTYLP